ncbi:MAG TPA: hypothetical protein VFQ45_10145 [Longimicrobium sp.]|nr:hypothetical protein [Longimicrobium sp.]
MIDTLRSVRSAFVALLFALTLYALAESAFAGAGTASEMAATEGLSACGTEANPCQLEALTIEAEPSGSSDARLVVSEHAPRMKLRVKS